MSTSAKIVSVVCKVGNVTIPINSISMRHTINALPTVEFTTQLSNRGSGTSINLEQFRRLNVIVQNRFYNQFSLTPDTVIVVTDGDNNQITFVGYLMAPQFRISSGQLSIAFSAIHVGAVFQAFNGSVYDLVPYYTAGLYDNFFLGVEDVGENNLLSQLEELPGIQDSAGDWDEFMGDDADLFTVGQQPMTDSIAHNIYTMIQNLHNTLTRDAANQPPDVQRIMNVAVLTANNAVLPFIKNLFMGSFGTTLIDGLITFGTQTSGDRPDSAALHETIYRILTQSPNLLAAIMNYLPPFLFQLNATWSGRMAIEPTQFLAQPGGRKIQAPIQDITFSLTSNHELPLAQVIVQSQPDEYYTMGGNFGAEQVPVLTQEENISNVSVDITPQNADLTGFFNTLVYASDTLRFLSRYPATPSVTAGRYLIVTAPSWTCPNTYQADDLQTAASLAPPPNRFSNAVSVYVAQTTRIQAKRKSRTNVLDYIAQLTYESAVLERTNAFITIPLSLAVQVGRTYDMQSAEGTSMYAGFLNSVTHTITLGEQGASATTSLDFSHIIVTGAELSGINVKVPTTVPDLTVASGIANLA